MQRQSVRYLRRGGIVTLKRFDPALTLLDHLRLEQRATGTKEGCNEGDCGACTVVLARLRDGKLVHEAVNSCILLAGQVDGAEVITIEDLAAGGQHPLQQAMVDQHASQCGFCTPGIVMSLFQLYQEGARPVVRGAVLDQLAGNLCRCTGYRPIIDAALQACAGAPDDIFSRSQEARIAALHALEDGNDLICGDETRFFAAPADPQALARLVARHPDAVLVGGATDVGLWITKKLKDMKKIIWMGRVSGLADIDETAAGLSIGAGVTVGRAAEALARLAPDLGEVVRRFGSRQVRASGTVGGNIANGSPIGDLAPCLIALDARVTLQSAEGMRTLPLESFFISYGRQDRQPGEFVRALTIPTPDAGQRFCAFKVSKRFDEDISTVLGAFRLDSAEGRITAARIAFGGMAATPKRAPVTEARLEGLCLADEAGRAAALAALEQDYAPISDMRASAAYRQETARALLAKALMECAGADPAQTRVLTYVAGVA